MPLIVSMPYKAVTKNKVVLLLGSPGTGKSYCIVRNEIFQALRRGASIVVFDPKGELYCDTSNLCRQMGWDVKVLNCINSNLSNAWNPALETFSYETQMLDSDRLDKVATTYITNMFPGQRKDFWTDGAKAVLQAMIGLHAYRYEQFVLHTLLNAIKAIYEQKGDPAGWKEIPESMKDTENVTIADTKKLFTAVFKSFGFRDDDITNILMDIEEKAPEVSLSAIYYDVLAMGDGNMAAIRQEISNIPRYHVAWAAFRTFDMGTVDEKVKGSTLQTLALSLSCFANEARRRMLGNNEINLWETSSKPCAYYVIADDTESVRPILSLFFNFLFDDCQQIWDRTEARCKETGNDPLQILRPVSVIMDEAKTIGTIPGFPTFLSKARSRHLDIMVTFQSLMQAQELYGETGVAEIEGCTEYIVYLGCNDIYTAQEISKYADETTGIAQSWTESTSVIAGPVGQVNYSETKIPLLSVADALRYGDDDDERLLVIKRAQEPLELKKFPYTWHPMAKGLTPVSIESTIRPLSQRFPDEYFRIKDREERKNIKGDDNRTVMAGIIRRILTVAQSIRIDEDDLESYEDLEDLADYENADDYVWYVEDPPPDGQKNKQNKEPPKKQAAGGERTPRKPKQKTVVDSTFREASDAREEERRKKTQSKQTKQKENPAESSELNDL